jgi:hypothetical protein
LYSSFVPLSGSGYFIRRHPSKKQNPRHSQSSEHKGENDWRRDGEIANQASASAELELAFANVEGFDPVLESGWWNSELGRRP